MGKKKTNIQSHKRRTDSMRIGISVPDKAKRYSEINLTTMRFNI